MDITDDESSLIHSKFRKAKRGFSQVVSKPATGPLEQPPGGSSIQIQSSGESFVKSVEHMHTKLDLPSQQSSGRLESILLSGGAKSPIFGSNVSLGASSASPTHSGTVPSAGSILAGATATQPSQASSTFHSEVFRFDSTDRERYLCSAISEEEEVFSPGPSPSTASTRSYDSPRITISPLRLQDSPPNLTPGTIQASSFMDSQNRLMARVHTGLAMLPISTVEQSRCLFGVPSSPVSPLTPNTPLSPSPLFSSDQTFQQGFLAELYRRSFSNLPRCHSDSDLPLLPESPIRHEPTDLSMKAAHSTKPPARPRKSIPHPLTMPSKGGSLESDQSSPQDSPLDLSMKGNRERFGSSTSCESLSTRFLSSLAIPPHSPGYLTGAKMRPDISSPTRNSVALRYNLEVSPVVEEMPPGSDMAFVCPVCGQMFSLHDRLAKHMASRHKSKPHDPNKSYPCDVCHRSFARSDMLTRHMRLHTGLKPYTCRVCGQVFSRSDHLSTHQRTHTGEKPYKCPQCPYSACRRDMITRHLRTHTRNSSSSSDQLGSTSTPTSTSESTGEDRPIKMEHSRPPSSSSSFAPDSPVSPALNLSSLSVNSPQPSLKE